MWAEARSKQPGKEYWRMDGRKEGVEGDKGVEERTNSGVRTVLTRRAGKREHR
jgi:hypothetical protein